MKRMMIAMTLILALVLGIAALAEVTEPEPPAEQGEQAVPEEAAAPEDEGAPEAEAADDAATLEDALKALRDARLSTKLDELQAELDEYVTAGKLTQEQADLIMNTVKERQEAKRNDDGCDCRQKPQIPGNQQQCPGAQGGSRQFGPFSGNQQDDDQMPQLPGNQQQFPGAQGGNQPFGQFPGRR